MEKSDDMYENLVEEITKEVLKRIKEFENSCQQKKTMLVLSEEPYPLSDAITKEYQLLTPDFSGCQKVVELHTMVSCAELILITSITAKQLADLALGCGEGDLEEAIRYALMLGKTIFVLEEGLEYRSYKATAHKTYYRRLLEYESCLKQYGMLFTTEKYFPMIEKQGKQTKVNSMSLENQKQSKSEEVWNEKEQVISLSKKLIMEKDLKELNIKSQTVVQVEKSSIITPSAFDYARAHMLRFVKM